MKISLLTLGTRGDVQPYAVLGKTLKERGHDVVISAGKNFESLASEYNLEFRPVEADFQALINSDEGKAMMKNPFLARKHFIRQIQPMVVGAMKIFYELSKDSDCVLYHVKSLGDYFADRFPGKMMRANVIPIQTTNEFPNPVFSALPFPKVLNRLTYKLADLGLVMMNGAINEFRTTNGLTAKFPKNLNVPSIYGISPSFLPRPKDFPEDSHFTGFWKMNSVQKVSSEINDFLSSGKETILITFGSMPFQANFDLQESIINLTRDLTLNVVVVKGLGFNDVSRLSALSSVKVIDNVPFDQIIPRVHGVVHDGGIGILSECLRAGIPSQSCPVAFPMGDQYFWGHRAYKMNCSPEPIPLKRMKDHLLNQKVFELISSEKLRKGAQHMASLLADEDGAERAADIIEERFKA
jgi:sterol 3beta-glucosyltransferase